MRAIALAYAGILAVGACTQDRIVFESTRALDGSDAGGSASNIWVVKANGTGLTPLTKGTNAGSVNPRWSPDGTRIVFESWRALDGTDAPNTNLESNIWNVTPDGVGLIPLTKGTDAVSLKPRWSPDGTRIVFQSNREFGALNIWLIKADGTGPTALTALTNTRFLGIEPGIPSWSPDGTRIVFVSGRALDGTDAIGQTHNIWLIKADGTGPTPLTTTKTAETGESSWSPDGTRIVFQSDRALDGTTRSMGPIRQAVRTTSGSSRRMAPV
jgi:TolB protein